MMGQKEPRSAIIIDRRVVTVTTLGTTQTLAWASSYYLPAMLAASMGRDLGVSVQTVFAAFSAALVLAAFLGPLAGRCIDKYGGRPVLMATNLIFAAGLAGLALAQETLGFFAAWLLIGAGMGAGLYEAAFSTVVRLYGHNARNAITGITLFAGFASTVGWPLSAWLELEYGWRSACMAWAALHLFAGLPLNASLPGAALGITPGRMPAAGAPDREAGQIQPGAARESRCDPAGKGSRQASVLLATVFAITWFISTAMAAHLPHLLQASGLTLAGAVAVSALVGPAQVVARLMEFSLLRRVHPFLSAQLAALAHPVGAACLLVFGGPAAILFTVLHGAGNGILTIAKGTLPLVIFGPQGYGLRQGLLMVPARIAQAAAPFIFGLLIDRWGASSLWMSGILGLLAYAALLWLAHGIKAAAAPAA
ncbi:MFS transporter [Pollutimonas bauzanensis]|uniref:Predicted arabinose efflux permease, MFS family n=1 Tax=Pollutimonas bauzanensis TaxID=658167 RepID=A0A1M5Z9Z6_9BURK|nr:MFS transporter [Pollutimonas bauzanensis]SHI21012.1 Predicted arabinose efflux permease, MFS family [Pollutimonas bauzanensis]